MEIEGRIAEVVRQLYGFSLRRLIISYRILEIWALIFIILSCLESCIVLARETGSLVL